MLKQVDALGNCWIFNMIQESCGRHDVGHWGMKALFSIFFKFGLEIALGLLLLALPRIFPLLCALMIPSSSCVTVEIIFVASVCGKITC